MSTAIDYFRDTAFWKLNVMGWVIYTFLSLSINGIYNYPVTLALLECAVLFGAFTVFFFLCLERLNTSVQKHSDYLHLFIPCALGLFVFSIALSFIYVPLLLELLSEQIAPQNIFGDKPDEVILLRLIWGRSMDAFYLFTIWLLMWIALSQLKRITEVQHTEVGRTHLKPALNTAILLCIVLVVVNIVSAEVVYAYPNFENIAIQILSTGVPTAIFFAVVVYLIYRLLIRGIGPATTHIKGLIISILIILIPASLTGVIVIDDIENRLNRVLSDGQYHTNSLDMSLQSISSLAIKFSGQARQAFHNIALISLTILVFSYFNALPAHSSKHSPPKVRLIPRSKQFWYANICSWLLLALIMQSIEGWKSSYMPLVAQAFMMLKILVLGALLSSIARYVFLLRAWSAHAPQSAIYRISILALFLGSCFAFMDSYFEIVIHTKFFDNEQFELIYSSIDKQLVSQTAYSKLVLYIIWFFVWLYVFYSFFAFKQKMDIEISRIQLQKENRDAQLSLLKNQLDPHFIFNTLTGLRYLVEKDPGAAREGLTQLSDLLRRNLVSSSTEKITIAQELELVRKYISLNSIQLEDRLIYQEQLSPSIDNYLLPPLTIQILVENAIKHGIARCTEGGVLRIEIRNDGRILQCEVSNTLPALGNESNSSASASQNKYESLGIGLENVKKRLHLIYDRQANFKFRIEDDKAICSIAWPVEERI